MYNTRRGSGFGRGNAPANNQGPRRSVQGNFVPGGQLRPNNQGQQNQQTPQRQNQNQPRNDTPVKNLQKTAEAAIIDQKIQEAKKEAPLVKQVATPVKQVATPVKQNAPPVKQNVNTPQPVPSPVVKKESTAEVKTEEVPLAPPPPPVLSTPDNETAEMVDDTEEESMDTSGDAKPRPPWMKKNKGKISKAEKVKRRNMRLRKILQPKNALMVLNEFAGATAYEFNEIQPNTMYCGTVQANFKATVTIDGQVHEGYGKSKPAAKTAAAEAALKYLVLTRISSNSDPAPAADEDTKPPATGNAEESNGEKMEVEEKEDDIPYCHLASFALYKLYSSWDDGGKIMSRSNSHSNLSSITNDSVKMNQTQRTPPEMRPSKKMPDHPEQMNPVMLLNQMYPNAVYEEVCKTGIPPKIVFTMKCSIDGKSYIGNGQNKKCARREAAFQACKELLGVQYPEND